MLTINCQFSAWNYPRCLFEQERSASDWRRGAKKVATAADKFETEGNGPDAVAVLRLLAKSDIAIAKSRKKKEVQEFDFGKPLFPGSFPFSRSFSCGFWQWQCQI